MPDELKPLLNHSTRPPHKCIKIIFFILIAVFLLIPTIIILALVYEPVTNVGVIQPQAVKSSGFHSPFTVQLEAEVSGGRETFLNYVWSFSDGQIKPILVCGNIFVSDVEGYEPLTIRCQRKT